MPQILEAAAIEKSLYLEAQQPCGKLEWFEESCREPGEFWRALKGTFDARFAAPGISSLFSRYNFYHDSIIRNLNNPAPALSWYDVASGFRRVSYRELGNMAAAKAGRWVRGGLEPGQTICIIRVVCLELIVEMLAALKAGCMISFLLPQGKSFLQRRLEALQPDHIVIDTMHLPLLSAWADKAIIERELRGDIISEREGSFAYASGQTVFRSFNACGHEPHTPTDITSDTAYLSALRDGLIALGLGPGHVYAAPGFHFMEICPSLFLAGLLCGATYLHLSPKAIAENAELVVQEHIHAFGVSKNVRDILLEKQVEIDGAWESWFRNPAESTDMERWYFFIRSLKLENSYSGNLRWNAALGGCSLFSVRRKGMAHMNVIPAAGSSWCLGDLSGGDYASPLDAGVYLVSAAGKPAKEKMTTSDIIVRNRQEWIFAGINGCQRDGRIFPVQEVLETLRVMGERYDLAFSIVDVPRIDSGSGHRIILVVFRGAKAGFDDARLLSEIRGVVKREMGDEFQPDNIEFFPLYPRFLSDSEVDHQWCRNQYLTGALFLKSRGEIFNCITQLKECTAKKFRISKGNVNQ